MTSDDLNAADNQLFYMAQESIDIAATALGLDSADEWDAQTKPINNVVDPTDDQDAATKNYVDQAALGVLTTPLSIANGGTGASTIATARIAMGLEDIYSITNYGAVGDGVTDDTIAIQATIDAVEAIGFGTVYFPAGSYLVSTTLTINSDGVYLRGAGKYISKLVRASDYGDTIFITGVDGTGTLLNNCGVIDLGFESTAVTTSGYHIHLNGVNQAQIRGINMLNGFGGIKCAGVVASAVDDWYLVFTNIFGGATTGRTYLRIVSASANYAHPSCGDLFFSNFNLRGNTAAAYTDNGISIDSADGLWFSNGHVGNTEVVNLALNKILNDDLALVYFVNVMFDICNGFNVVFDGNTGTGIGEAIEFANCNIKGGGTSTAGVTFASGTPFTDVQFNGGEIWQHVQDGVRFISTSTNRVSFSNVNVRENSFNSAGSFDGYKIDAGVTGVNISGGSSGGDSKQGYGVHLASGASDDIQVSGADLRGNFTGSVQNFASGNNVVFGPGCISDDSTSVASAAAIALPSVGEVFTITGTTTITSIAALWKHRRVTLVFAGVLTVTDGSNLKLAGNLVTTADDTITLVCDGTNWIETSRSVN
jgi:hypothetical protein